MDRFQRIFRLHQLLSARRHPVSLAAICAELECSRASANRIFKEMRLYFDAPIQYDRARNGYFYAKSERPYELPGLWFSASELYALLSAQHFLSSVQPGLLGKQLAPLRDQIHRLLNQGSAPSAELTRRIRILAIGHRKADPKWFESIASAVLQRKRLFIIYVSRSRNEESERDVSPQRLTHYRDNWYLDAWCHSKNGLRSFALDCIRNAEIIDQAAQEIAEEQLDLHFASSYGIFAGIPCDTAVLRFSAERARWVAEEQWHPQQQSRFLDDGRYELSLPYSDPRELAMDILKYGPDVEVIAPDTLVNEIKGRLKDMNTIYGIREKPDAWRRT